MSEERVGQQAPLRVGSTASVIRVVTQQLVEQFSAVSGDSNPIHLDPDYAKETPFGRCIAPGLLIGSFVSALLANELPGPGTIYLKQDLKFLKPVFLGMQVQAIVRVSHIDNRRNHVTLDTQALESSAGLELVSGQALVKVPAALLDGR